MGKAQKKKAMRRHNPVRVPDSHLPQGLSTVSTSSKQEAILPIISKVRLSCMKRYMVKIKIKIL